MNILERAKKLVCDMTTPYQADRSRLKTTDSVQVWPEWAQRDFRLACDAMVAVNEPNAELERDNARLRDQLKAVRELCTTDHESKERLIARVLLCLPNSVIERNSVTH